MPLVYDDVPGSWGAQSEDWPFLKFQNKSEYAEAWKCCVMEVPYGSYVGCDGWRPHTTLVIRFETTAYKQKVHEYMQAWRRKTRGLHTGPGKVVGCYLMRGPARKK